MICILYFVCLVQCISQSSYGYSTNHIFKQVLKLFFIWSDDLITSEFILRINKKLTPSSQYDKFRIFIVI